LLNISKTILDCNYCFQIDLALLNQSEEGNLNPNLATFIRIEKYIHLSTYVLFTIKTILEKKVLTTKFVTMALVAIVNRFRKMAQSYCTKLKYKIT